MSTLTKKNKVCGPSASRGVSGRGERSFTLIETLIALGLMLFLVMEVGGVHGNALYFNRYGRQVTQGVWLAKRLMSQVEYQWTIRPFKELETANEKERPFEDFPDFTYSLEVKEWKLPILDLITGGVGGGDDSDKKKPEGGGDDVMKSAMKNVFGDSILKTAHVEVFWAEGAKRNSVALTYLLTNQEKLDELLTTLKGASDAGGAPGTPPATGIPPTSGTPNPAASPTPDGGGAPTP